MPAEPAKYKMISHFSTPNYTKRLPKLPHTLPDFPFHAPLIALLAPQEKNRPSSPPCTCGYQRDSNTPTYSLEGKHELRDATVRNKGYPAMRAHTRIEDARPKRNARNAENTLPPANLCKRTCHHLNPRQTLGRRACSCPKLHCCWPKPCCPYWSPLLLPKGWKQPNSTVRFPQSLRSNFHLEQSHN